MGVAVGDQTTLGAMSLYFVFSVGVLGQPHVMHKFFMIRDPKQLKWYPLMVTVAMVLVILLMVGVGMAVKYLVVTGEMAPLPEGGADATAPLFLLGYTPALLAAIVFAGMAAAAMSTVDGFVNVGAAALTRDLPSAFGHPVHNELRVGRTATVVLSLAAAALAHVAHLNAGLVGLLGIFGYGVFAASLMPVLAIGLNWSRVTRAAALASVGTGLVTAVGLEVLALTTAWSPPGGVSSSAIALIASIVTLLGVTGFTTRGQTSELPRDVRTALEL